MEGKFVGFLCLQIFSKEKNNRKSKYICDFFTAILKTFFSLKFYASIIVIIQFKKKTIFFFQVKVAL